MPPQTKFNKEDTVEAAFRIVRRQGWEKLSARSIASELGSSTMPVYSNLGSMGDLEETIIKKALDLQLSFQKTPRTGDPILDLGLGYVLFAKHERHLFKAINDEKHGQLQVKLGEENFEFVVQTLSQDARAKGMSEDQLRVLVFFWWVFVHGLANMNNNLAVREFDETEIADCIRKAGGLIMRGFLADTQGPEKIELG
ncbi:MAG: TetR/AcrR family transcriptional regulator [Desulfomonilaceae bacterium]